MRITIDTEKKVIICPKTFWEDIRKANETLRNMGITNENGEQKQISHKDEVVRYFNEAIKNDLVRAVDVKKK